MTITEYSLLLINPIIERLDSVVVGAVFKSQSGWDVRVASSVAKMQAINPSFPSSKLVQTSALAREMVLGRSGLAELRSCFEGGRWGLTVDKFVGTFTYSSDAEYQQQVAAVLAESVNPPSLAQSNAAPVSRRRNVVRRNLRSHFRARGLWSRHDDDINNHRVVEQFPISAESGIVAEFALRNRVMHITETIDFEIQSLAGKKLLAQAKTLVLTESSRVFGNDTRKYVVAAGSNREDARHSMHLLREHAQVFALESSADLEEYVGLISAAAGSVQQTLS